MMPHPAKFATLAVTALAGMLSLAGCVTETATPPRHGIAVNFDDPFAGATAVVVGKPGQSPRVAPTAPPAAGQASPKPLSENNPVIDWDDPCVASMDTVVESLLMYYSLYRKLPDTLQQLPERSPSGAKLSIICPATGLPYQYFSQGFELRRDFLPANVARDPGFIPPTLLLFDARPAHQIRREFMNNQQEFELHSMVRYGIVMEHPGADRAVKMYIVPLDEALLDMYLKSSTHVPGADSPVPAPPGAAGK